MSTRGWTIFAASVVAVLAWAVFARTWNVSQRPLWQDEACLAELVFASSYAHLLKQAEIPSPPLFAVTTKLLASWVSPPEVGLRLFSILCGIAVVPLVYCAARALGGARTVALAAMVLSASSVLLVVWSREYRQYEAEALFSVLLAWLAFRLRRAVQPGQRRALAAGVILLSATGPWFGYGLAFAAATLLGALVMLRPIGHKGQVTRITALIGLAALALSVVILVRQVASNQAANEALSAYLGNWFIDMGEPTDWLRAAKYAAGTTCMVLVPIPLAGEDAVVLGLGAVIWVLVLVGIRTWPRRGRVELACWVIVPWVLMLAAAVMHRYPFGVMRLMVFLAPGMCVALAGGVIAIGRICAQIVVGRGAPGIVAAVILTAVPIVWMVQVPLANRYWVRQDFPGMLQALETEREPSEHVFVTRTAVPSIRYYAGERGRSFVYMPLAAGTRPVPRFDYDTFIRDALRAAGRRAWVLTTSVETEPLRQLLFAEARKLGYEPKRVAGAAMGEDAYDEVAQLYRLDRSLGSH